MRENVYADARESICACERMCVRESKCLGVSRRVVVCVCVIVEWKDREVDHKCLCEREKDSVRM